MERIVARTLAEEKHISKKSKREHKGKMHLGICS